MVALTVHKRRDMSNDGALRVRFSSSRSTGAARYEDYRDNFAICPGREAMLKTSAVVRHTGKRINLERGFEKLEVHWPTNPVAQKIFMEIQPGRLVDEGTLRLFTRRK
jgi:hypothetical protein